MMPGRRQWASGMRKIFSWRWPVDMGWRVTERRLLTGNSDYFVGLLAQKNHIREMSHCGMRFLHPQSGSNGVQGLSYGRIRSMCRGSLCSLPMITQRATLAEAKGLVGFDFFSFRSETLEPKLWYWCLCFFPLKEEWTDEWDFAKSSTGSGEGGCDNQTFC